MHPPPIRRISVLMNTRFGFCRDILEGLRRYAGEDRGWYMSIHEMSTEGLKWAERSHPDGMIAHAGSQKLLEKLDGLGVPWVNTSTALDQPRLPLIGLDNLAIGHMAAEHFLQKGFRDVAIVEEKYGLARDRMEGCRDRLTEGRCKVHLLPPFIAVKLIGQTSNKKLADWIRHLPSPLGWFARNDIDALNLLYYCRIRSISVPDEICVLGVDNDESLCLSTTPRISSIQLPGRQIGYRAGEVMDLLLEGKLGARKRQHVEERFPPIRVIQRASTDFQNYRDPLVSRAIQIMRRGFSQGMNVADVLTELGCSRSALEKAFRKELQHSPLRQLHLLRCQEAMNWMRDPEISLEEIAGKCGFRDNVTFWSVFKKQTGQSPGAFRKQNLKT